jgi:hypothetical protein
MLLINKENVLFNNSTNINVSRIDRKHKRKYIIEYRFFVWHMSISRIQLSFHMLEIIFHILIVLYAASATLYGM